MSLEDPKSTSSRFRDRVLFENPADGGSHGDTRLSTRSEEAFAQCFSPVCGADANLGPVEPRPSLRQAHAMDPLPRPLAFFLLVFSGWVNRHQQAIIDYLLEENRVLRTVNGSRRLRLTDDQRRRLAVKGNVLGRRHLAAVAGIVTPDTILRWYRSSSPRSTTVRRRGAPAVRRPSQT